MPQARKQTTKRPAEQEKYRAELTSSQLVIGICILMMFGLACFLVGVLVGKFDAAPAPDQIARTETPVSARTVRLAPPEPEPEPEPAPALTTQPVTPQPSPGPNASVETTDLNVSGTTNEPRVITLPGPKPNPEPEKPAQVQSPDASAAPEPEEPAKPVVEQPAPTPVVEEPATQTPAEDSPEPEPQPVAETPEPQNDVLEPELEPVDQIERSSPPPAAAVGQLTVQVGAFSKQENAELAKKKIQAATRYPVFLVDSTTGTLVKVHVGIFGAESEAEIAKQELTRLGYSESIITKHSIALTQAPSN